MIRSLFLAASMLLSGAHAQSECGPHETWDGQQCIPAGCASGTHDDGAGTCVTGGCASGFYQYFETCMSTCPEGTYKYNSNCVGGCPARVYKGECVEYCPANTFDYNNGCVDVCPSHTVTVGDRCLDSCPESQVAYEGACYDNCPAAATYTYNGWCVDECWKMGLYYESRGSSKCVSVCPAVYQHASNTCVDQCEPGQKELAGGCYDKCPSAIPYEINGTCDVRCPNYIDTTTMNCVDACPEGTVLLSEDGKCGPCSYSTADGKCGEPPSTNTNTNDECPTYMYRNVTDGTCTYWCGPDMVGFNGTCVDRCPSVAPFKDGSMCVERCPVGFIGNSVTGNCECAGFWTRNGECLESCPTGMVSIYDKYCTEKCPADMKQNGTRCDPLCGHGQILMDGVCTDWTDNGNWTDGGSHCKPYEYLNSNGTCILYGPTCAADQWFWNSTCITACREGEVLTMEGTCMSIVDICPSSLPGSVMNNVTRQCECPAGSWITRDREAKDPSRPPVRCAPSSGEAPRIDCGSFVRNAIYDVVLDNCVCPAAYPVVVPIPDVAWFPYACAPLGTVSTIKQCERPSYFDFLEGRCVSGSESESGDRPTPAMTAKPSFTTQPTATETPTPTATATATATATTTATATATATALPSRYPSRSPSTTHTPARSAIPGSPSPSTTPSRSVKPSGLVFAADVSRAPLPSLIAVRPPPAAAQKSAAPSPWPKRVEFELPPEEKPAYIDARMTIAGANATEAAKPERIQQVQASLACTLRMPLENIRIQNIMVTDADGVESRVPVDPTAFMMVGDGSSDCYEFRNLTRNRRLLRALSGSSTGAIHIDYAIVAPSDEILAMDTAQFNDVLSKSPVLIAASTAVGGTGVTAVATDTRRVVYVRPSTSPGATVADSIDMRLALGVGISCFAAVIIATAMSIFYCRETVKDGEKANVKTPAGQTQVTQPPRAVLVYDDHHQHHIVNPLSATATSSAAFADAGRVDYSPQTSRGPVQQTHRRVFGTGV
jgi:hypothetical protein